MKIDLQTLATLTDDGKAIATLEHTFYPYKDNEEVKVRCSYLTNSDINRFTTGNTLDLDRIIRDKVHKIEGIEITLNGKDVALTPKLLVSLPYNQELAALQMIICAHLMDSTKISEEEEKNSDSDTNA